jgi:phosphoglucosamine mutase
MGKYFGTDGIRGRYNIELTNGMAFKVGQSLKAALQTDKLVIGMDTRESSSELLYSVISGAQSVGIDVMNAGIVSTPLISLYALKKGVTGVMITASHNPYHDNGIKVFNKGRKLLPNEESIIEDYIDNNATFEVNKLGQIYSGEDVLDVYLDLIESLDLYQTDLKIGVDSSNGANYLIAKGIFSEITETFMQTGDNPDGKNINKGVGSTNIEHIQNFVLDNKLDIGFSFDGDGDRVLVVDQEGTLYDGDQIIYILAIYLQELGLLKNNTVVLTKMSNLGIIKAFERQGIDVVLTDVGDKYVLKAMLDNDFVIGGENSGHIILKQFMQTGDGLLVALYLLKILVDQGKSLKELTKDITFWPQEMVNIRTFDKSILSDERVVSVVNKVKSELKDNGKVLVRASGTEPLVRVTLSTETKEELEKYMDLIVSTIKMVKEEV